MEQVLEAEEQAAARKRPREAPPPVAAAGGASRKVPLEDCPDAELVAACLDGEREGFTVLTRRYGPGVVAFAFSRLGDRDRAEEIAQEALVRAFERLWSLRSPRVFAAWLLGIANNVILQEIERRSRSVPLEEAPPATTESGPAEATAADETRRRLLAEVDALPGHYRVAMILKYQEQLSCEEIAERLGVSEGTVRSRLSRAYRMLRKALADYEELL